MFGEISKLSPLPVIPAILNIREMKVSLAVDRGRVHAASFCNSVSNFLERHFYLFKKRSCEYFRCSRVDLNLRKYVLSPIVVLGQMLLS